MVISSTKFCIQKRRRGTHITNTTTTTNTNTTSPIKLKHRSARVRFDLNEQLWFVEAPAYKKKKGDSKPAANMSSTERVGRAANTNNNKDRSRSNSLTSLRSNSSRTSKNTATSGKKISSSNNKMKAAVDKQQPNLPDIDNSMDRVPDIRAKEKSLSPLQPRSNSSNSNNSNNSSNSKARAKAPKTSVSKNKINAITFPRILAIHQSASATNDK